MEKPTQERATAPPLDHDSYFEALRAREFSRLDAANHTYLDYTGGNLYPQSLLDGHHQLLSEHTFGNPHSANPSSKHATELVHEAREKVIRFFNADDYHCIFTQNASGALKIVGECYPFSDQSVLMLLSDNHNSVNGIREYARSKGGDFCYAPIQYEDLRVDGDELRTLLKSHDGADHKMFGFPAQSNVSGVKHDLGWIAEAQEAGWDVLLDCAAFVPSNPLDLTTVSPDFVSISFYKIFGYPTGLGALLVRKDKFDLLRKPWFAGGTVKLAAVKSPHFYLADNHERFENGTVDYLGIPAVTLGLETMESIGIQRLQERVGALRNYLHEQLSALTHSNGEPQIRIFGPKTGENTGSSMIMAFFNPDGNPIPFQRVEQLANEETISIRSGCFCNPGIDEVNNCLTTEELAAYFTSRDKGDFQDMVAYLRKMRGAIRVSVGMATTRHDLDTFISFVASMKDRRVDIDESNPSALHC